MFKTIGHDPREFRSSNSCRACGDFNITMDPPKQIEQHPAKVIRFTCHPSVNQHRCGKPHHLKIIFQGQPVASFALGGLSSNVERGGTTSTLQNWQHAEELGIGRMLGTRGRETDLPGCSISCGGGSTGTNKKNGGTW